MPGVIPGTKSGRVEAVITENNPDEWDKFVSSLSGGLTIVRKAVGHWLNPATNIHVKEDMVAVRVACTDEQLDKILKFSLDYYKQDAIMAYEISNNVIFSKKV